MKIQATIGGYEGEPVTAYGYLDAETGVLAVSAMGKARKDRFKDCVVVANIAVDNRDSEFSDAELSAAIDAWMDLAANRLLSIDPAAQRGDPASVVAVAKIEAAGRKSEISPSARNEHIAILALCWQAKIGSAITKNLAWGDRLARLRAGRLITI